MSSTDSTPNNQEKLFEKQQRVFPKRVWGKYRKIKWIVMIITLSIYYLAPFMRYDRGPIAPDQAILIDMTHGRGYFFFIEIWPQEVYYLTGILILLAVSLFFVTSLFGRIWCGYMCPQTVWTDLFVWVERIVQGDRNARQKLSRSKWSFDKSKKMALTHSIWLVISMLTGGAWVFYFNDAPTLLDNILHLNIPTDVLTWIIALTFSTYLMAGFAREQVCTYMCPYARFQSAMFDRDSLIIGYDNDRGEDRGRMRKGQDMATRGHCVDCTACVQVCPMGIDIRDGLQMECIACGLCVDACNNVMDKLALPKGLIRYDTADGLEVSNIRASNKPQARFIRPRTIWYSLILIVVSAILLVSLVNRSMLELHVLHDRNPLFVQMSDGTIRNGYDIRISNKTLEDKNYSLSVSGLESISIRIQAAGTVTADDLLVFANSVGHFRVFVTGTRQKSSQADVIFTIKDNNSPLQEVYTSTFVSNKHEH